MATFASCRRLQHMKYRITEIADTLCHTTFYQCFKVVIISHSSQYLMLYPVYVFGVSMVTNNIL